jgi:hypothetical protein
VKKVTVLLPSPSSFYFVAAQQIGDGTLVSSPFFFGCNA